MSSLNSPFPFLIQLIYEKLGPKKNKGRVSIRNVLLIGRSYHLMWALPQLLAKAGFNVDVISSSFLMRYSRFVRDNDYVSPHQSLLPAITQRMKREYDWIVVTEDGVLQEILRSSLVTQDKLKLLPVQREENFSHLYSKIGLSQTFMACGVNTPPFVKAYHIEEAQLAANLLGYPVFVKCDSAGGGSGVFECKTFSDFQLIPSKVFESPVLVQKRIFGVEFDVSAVYLEEDLVHFSYAIPEKICMNPFGPSSLRTYQPLSAAPESLFHELAQIGKVLGAHGFTNISCIQQADGRRFYFEADMRPNVWIDFPRFFGEDPSLRIQKWFSQREKLNYPVPVLPHQPPQMLIPYFLRLDRWELVVNRYHVWQFIPAGDPKLIICLILNKIFGVRVRDLLVPCIKWVIPKKHHPWAKRIYFSLIKTL